MVDQRPIPSCPNYFADELGFIWRSGSRIKEMDNGNGYKRIKVGLGSHGVHDRYVHRLVCEAFHGPAPDGYQARHHNGKRADNRPENLSWATRAENEADKLAHGTLIRGEASKGSILTDEMVLTARARAAAGERQDSIARDMGFDHRLIGAAVRGDRWAHLPGAVPANTSRRRFTDEEVREIRLSAGKLSQQSLADRFGVARNAIWQVVHRKSYEHVL